MNIPVTNPILTAPLGVQPLLQAARLFRVGTTLPKSQDWLKKVMERFYVKYVTSGMSEHQVAIGLSKQQEKIEILIKSVLTQEKYQLVQEWEAIMNQRHSIEVESTYEVGVKGRHPYRARISAIYTAALSCSCV